MKVVQVVGYHKDLQQTDAPEPKVTSALDVIVKIGAAGVCRTDLHIIEGQWEEKAGVKLPYTIGHENAGWVHAVGEGVTNVKVGDKVILHPLVTCGLCQACRFGDDVHCENSTFPGINVDGGYAEYLKTTARSCIKLDDKLEPADVAALADAGLDGVSCCCEGSTGLATGQLRRNDRRWWTGSHRHPSHEGYQWSHSDRHRSKPRSFGSCPKARC